MKPPRMCRILGHRYYPDLLHCKRCNHCRGGAPLGRIWVRCTINPRTGEHRGVNLPGMRR